VVVLRVIGWLLIVAALLALGWDIFFCIHDWHFGFQPAGAAWYRVWPSSMIRIQALIENHIWKTLWNPVIETVLRLPLWLVLGIPGLLLAFLARTRRRRRFAR
jgi:ABC-type sugar transport system permease subunit